MNGLFYAVTLVIAVCSLVFFVTAAGAVVIRALRSGGRREDATANQEALAVSRFTIPVSIIVPVDDGSADLVGAIQRLLALDYPEFEVVVIGNGLRTADTRLETLKRAYQLEAREFFYRRTLTTSPVNRILRSQREPRLIVVEKDATSIADAINCGIDFARFRFVAAIPADVIFEGDALLRAMSPALRDPARVLAVASHVERRGDLELTPGGSTLTTVFQRLSAIRDVMESRLVWASQPSGSAPSDAIVAWRRDAVMHAGGFADGAEDAVLDLVRRVEGADKASGARVVRTAEIVGYAAPLPTGEAIEAVGRRRRAAWRSAGRMFAESSRRAFAVVELALPAAGAALMLSTIAGAAMSWWSGWVALVALAVLAFGQATMTSAALLMRAAAPGSPDGSELARLVLAGPLELFVSQPLRITYQLASLFGREVAARR